MPACCSSDTCRAPKPDPEFRRMLWIALAFNVSMFFAKAAASFVAGSVSLQADALDFLRDAGNFVLGLLVLGLGFR